MSLVWQTVAWIVQLFLFQLCAPELAEGLATAVTEVGREALFLGGVALGGLVSTGVLLLALVRIGSRPQQPTAQPRRG